MHVMKLNTLGCVGLLLFIALIAGTLKDFFNVDPTLTVVVLCMIFFVLFAKRG